MTTTQETNSNLYMSERLPKSDFTEGLPCLIKDLEGLDTYQIVKRLTLNVGYEVYKIRRVLKEMKIDMSFKTVEELRTRVTNEWRTKRNQEQLRRCRTSRTKFKEL